MEILKKKNHVKHRMPTWGRGCFSLIHISRSPFSAPATALLCGCGARLNGAQGCEPGKRKEGQQRKKKGMRKKTPFRERTSLSARRLIYAPRFCTTVGLKSRRITCIHREHRFHAERHRGLLVYLFSSRERRKVSLSCLAFFLTAESSFLFSLSRSSFFVDGSPPRDSERTRPTRVK